MDKQTAKLIARIAENLPDSMNPRQMQRLIDDPKSLKKALRKALCPVTLVNVTTTGRTGEEWIAHLEQKKYCVDDIAKQLLRNAKFTATNGVTYTLAVIMGDEFEDADRTNQNIRTEAYQRGYVDPTVEVAPYLRKIFSNEDLKKMGLWALIIMHEPIPASFVGQNLLGLSRLDDRWWLYSYDSRPHGRWGREVGFLFLVPAGSPACNA